VRYGLSVAKAQPSPTAADKPALRVRRLAGRDQWNIPTALDPTAWVEVQSDDPLWDGYWFRVTFQGGDVCGFDVRRIEDSVPITARRLKVIPFGAIEQCARERIHSWLTEYVAGRPEAAKRVSTVLEDWLAVFDIGGSVEAESIDARDRKLAPIAKRYTETIGDRDQVRILATEFDYSPDHIPNLIRQARKRGLLSPTTRGRAGGELTGKARAILSGEPVGASAPPEHPRMAEAVEANQRMKEALEAGDMDEWNRLVDEANKEAGHG
jgi:hypothetical protein